MQAILLRSIASRWRRRLLLLKRKRAMRDRRFAIALFAAVVSAIAMNQHASAQCQPQWMTGFGVPTMDNRVRAVTTFDDGTGGGPLLYAAGDFVVAAGGATVNRIARLVNSNWQPLGAGISGARVNAMAAFNDGSGSALFVAGKFDSAGGISSLCLAKWNGTSWSAIPGLQAHPNNEIFALTVFDDGSGGGPALYVGGNFLLAGGQFYQGVVKWNGSTLITVGGQFTRKGT